MRRLALLLVTGVTAGVAGCGDNVDFTNFPAEERDATCSYLVRCGSFGSRDDCRAYFERFSSSNASLEAAIDAGKVRYDGGAAADCVDALENLDCELAAQDGDSLAACDDVFTGTGQLGATCAFDLECQSDRCIVPDCTDACCLGTCGDPRRYPGIDEPCTAVCDADLYCGIDQLCHAPLGPGEPCNGLSPCAWPYYCSDTTSTCAARPLRGQPCDGECASEGDVCNASGVCAAAGTANDPCTDITDCSQYYVCNPDSRTCVLAPSPPENPNGTPCTSSTECASHYCDALCMDPPLCF